MNRLYLVFFYLLGITLVCSLTETAANPTDLIHAEKPYFEFSLMSGPSFPNNTSPNDLLSYFTTYDMGFNIGARGLFFGPGSPMGIGFSLENQNFNGKGVYPSGGLPSQNEGRNSLDLLGVMKINILKNENLRPYVLFSAGLAFTGFNYQGFPAWETDVNPVFQAGVGFSFSAGKGFDFFLEAKENYVLALDISHELNSSFSYTPITAGINFILN